MWSYLSSPTIKFHFLIVQILFLLHLIHKNEVEGGYSFVKERGLYKFLVVVKGRTITCTGTIVSHKWVLTSAHCVDRAFEHEYEFALIAGGTTSEIEDSQRDTLQLRRSVEIQLHPNWTHAKSSETFGESDIALVRVEVPFTFDKLVDKIDVAGNPWTKSDEKNKSCMSFGFGSWYGDKSPIKYLKTWNLTAGRGQKACPCASGPEELAQRVCAKSCDIARLCRGDSGGPMVCGNVVKAVARMNRNWQECHEPPLYPLENCLNNPDRGMTVYTFLCPSSDWLHSIVPEIPAMPDGGCGSGTEITGGPKNGTGTETGTGAVSITYCTIVIVSCLWFIYFAKI